MATDFAIAYGIHIFFGVPGSDGVFLGHRLLRASLLSLLLRLLRRLLRFGWVLLRRILALRGSQRGNGQEGTTEYKAQGLPQDRVHKHLRLPSSIHPETLG